MEASRADPTNICKFVKCHKNHTFILELPRLAKNVILSPLLLMKSFLVVGKFKYLPVFTS